MGRMIIAEESVDQQIQRLLAAKENKTWFVGVIIGQQSANRDYVVHLARTPDPVADEAHEQSSDENSNATSSDNSLQLERPKSLTDLNDQWVHVHAKQVTRMLPGGLSIVGLFAIAPPDMLKKGQAKLQQLMYSVFKQLNKSAAKFSTTSLTTDRILMQLDTTTQRISCVTLDTAETQKGTKPADWKSQKGASKWCRLNASINMDIPFCVPENSSAQTLLKQIQVGLSEFVTSLDKSIITFEDQMLDSNKVLSSSAVGTSQGSKVGVNIHEQKQGAKLSKLALKGVTSLDVRSQSSIGCSTTASKLSTKTSLASASTSTFGDNLNYDVSIYLPLLTDTDPTTVDVKECKSKIYISGASLVRAFVSMKGTVEEAIEAVKTDVMRSISARCELLCEEFDVAGEEIDSQVFDPPIRLFVQFPHTTLQVCDYIFQDEKIEEVIKRIEELLDIKDFELDDMERGAAEEESVSQPALPHIVDAVLETTEDRRVSIASSTTLLGVVSAGVVGAVAGAISYFMSDDS